MSFFDGYKREERSRLTPGDYRVAITDVEETTSRNGNPMLVVTVQPNGSEIHIKHYLVKSISTATSPTCWTASVWGKISTPSPGWAPWGPPGWWKMKTAT